MAVIGTAEILVTANVDKLERELKSKVQQAASRTHANIEVDTGRSPGLISSFTGLIDKADDKLKEFGLTSRDVSVILGAGLAGGVAFAAKSIVGFVADVTKAAADLGEAQNLVQVTFGDAADEVLRFAETAPTALGTTETAALNAAGQVGQLGKSFGLTEQLAAKLGTTVVRIATDISSLRNVPIEQVQQAIESAFAGESEPLRRLGVDTRETRLQTLALAEGLIEEGDALDNTSRAMAVLAAINRDAGDAFGDFANTANSLPNQLRTFNAELDKVKTQVGQVFLPLATEVLGFANELVKAIIVTSEFFDSLIAKATEAEQGIIDKTSDAIQKIPGLGHAGNEAFKAFVDSLRAAGINIGQVSDEEEKAADSGNDLRQSIDDIINSSKSLPLTADNIQGIADKAEQVRDEIDKITDARERLNDAIIEGEERVDEAEKRLIKTIQDNERRVDEAEKNLAKTRRDAARDAKQAQEEHAKTIQDAAKRIEEAQQHLEDVRLEADKRRADAREALEETRLDAKKRVADAEEQLDEARRQRAEQILSATLSVEEALFAGDALAERRARRALADAQRDRSVKQAAEDLLDTQKDALRDVTEAEENLAEVRLQTRKDVQEAEQDLADTIVEQNERVAESAQRLNDLEISLNERLMDAEKRLDDARREQAERVAEAQKDRLKAIDESNEKVRDARDALAEAAGATGDWAERLKVLNDQLQRLNELLQISTATGTLGDLILLNGLQGNAAGGSVRAGGWSVVGEEGPELVKWGSNATVVPNDQLLEGLKQLLQGGGSGGTGVIQNISVSGVDPRVLVNELRFLMMQGVVT